MKDYDYQSKEVQSQIQTGNNKYEEFVDNMGGQKQLETIKKQLKSLKAQVKQSSLHETLLYNSLYSFRVQLSKENTKHHLFDNLDGEQEKDPIKEKDFTEEDLEAYESNKNEWEFQVKSTPRKASVKDSGIDPNNPYINNNLDADLGTVIGKHRANRKQIDTKQFMLAEDEITSAKSKGEKEKTSDR